MKLHAIGDLDVLLEGTKAADTGVERLVFGLLGSTDHIASFVEVEPDLIVAGVSAGVSASR